MAENIQTDSDSQGPIQPGVGRSDQSNKSLHQINPNWVEDGYGVVGPQRQVIPKPQLQPPRMDFGIDNSRPSNASESGLIVTVEDVSGYTGGGITILNGVTTLTFDNTVFDLYDGGGGQAIIKCHGS